MKITGPLSAERVEALKEAVAAGRAAISDAAQKAGGKIDILLDMTDFDGTYDVGAMDVMSEFAKQNRPFIRKTAGFGKEKLVAVLGDIVAALADRENIKFFGTKEDAVAWLQA